jgi:hypothetical protein
MRVAVFFEMRVAPVLHIFQFETKQVIFYSSQEIVHHRLVHLVISHKAVDITILPGQINQVLAF